MSRDGDRSFFVLYNNGDTFYFTVEPNSGIYCTRFKNIYENSKQRRMPGAHTLEFTGDSFNLKSITGETIYSLEDYNDEISSIIPMPEELPTIARLYIDEDVRAYLIGEGMLKYDAKASNIPGLLDPQMQEESESKGFARIKRPQPVTQTTIKE